MLKFSNIQLAVPNFELRNLVGLSLGLSCVRLWSPRSMYSQGENFMHKAFLCSRIVKPVLSAGLFLHIHADIRIIILCLHAERLLSGFMNFVQ